MTTATSTADAPNLQRALDDDLPQIDLAELDIQSSHHEQSQQESNPTEPDQSQSRRPKSSFRQQSRPSTAHSRGGRQAWGQQNGDVYTRRPSSPSKETGQLLNRRRNSAKSKRHSVVSNRKRSVVHPNGRILDLSDSSDSEEELIALRRSQASRLSQSPEYVSLRELQVRDYRRKQCSEMWKEFETHIRCIDIDTMSFQPKPAAKASSPDFKNVMDGIQGEIRQKQQRKKGLKNTMFMAGKMSVFKQRALVELAKDEAEAEAAAEAAEQQKRELERRKSVASTVSAGRRGWNIIKHHLQEQRMEKKKNQSMGGWNLLAKTMRQLTDTERTRQELYDRYLKKSNFWAEGLTNYPQFLKDRDVKIKRRGPSRKSGTWNRPVSSMSSITSKQSVVSAPRENGRSDAPARRSIKHRPHSIYTYRPITVS